MVIVKVLLAMINFFNKNTDYDEDGDEKEAE